MMIWPVFGVSGNGFATFAFVSNNFEGTLKRALDCASYHNDRVASPLAERVVDIVARRDPPLDARATPKPIC